MREDDSSGWTLHPELRVCGPGRSVSSPEASRRIDSLWKPSYSESSVILD